MALDRPRWGTCAVCRWAWDRPRNERVGHLCHRYPIHVAVIDSADTCGEWEPPEGMVCGNCGRFSTTDSVAVDRGEDVWGSCSARQDKNELLVGLQMLELYHGSTSMGVYSASCCPAWSWKGPEDA